MEEILKKTAWHLATHIDNHIRKNAKKEMVLRPELWVQLAERLQHEVKIEKVIFEGLQKLGLGDKNG